ncbi:PEPxxWA-CTERM sorting domain-containing protein [Glacieibacterium frigidum]|uniref:PEP-CTERM sorting domain-containing protein n=1 Tax=Glacieibacterium frigidum TaxID=2593303 RepID=A0A552UFZ3_9SPHN|nr:PEPxxWA-CTERM sorting domain-containing protein [Glacieibacterium frigidum]TRW17142.1 PEP-CTERM sorting domain-containing protein [Glacieibacterium frigidum]
MFRAVALAAALLAAAPVAAVTQVYDTAPTTPGTQAWGGTLGLDFTVNTQVTVTSLGTFDSGKDGITNNIFVGIFNLANGQLVAPAVNFNGTANAGGTAYVSQAVSSIVLAAGNYQLAAWGYNLGADLNFNNEGPGGPITFNSLFGALTAVGTRYSNNDAPGVLATNADVGTTRYGAGTFAAYVPEPATWGLLITGFAMTGVAMRRRKAALAA